MSMLENYILIPHRQFLRTLLPFIFFFLDHTLSIQYLVFTCDYRQAMENHKKMFEIISFLDLLPLPTNAIILI